MKILIAGIDGYIGWPLALHLGNRGHEVYGIDNQSRRHWVHVCGSHSAIPIVSMEDRVNIYSDLIGCDLHYYYQDMNMGLDVFGIYKEVQPDVIVYLSEMPSASYSMIDCSHAVETQRNNVLGTLKTLFAIKKVCPKAHLVKLGTMGEYGTPDLDIPEGFFQCEHKGRSDYVMFPRDPGSFYHLSKVHDTYNVRFACKNWGLRSTDVMQGVVYGTGIDLTRKIPAAATRFDFDEYFGTVINRFVAQACVGVPLTPYGSGGQTRGFLPLVDSIQCLAIAVENPPEQGEYRTFNQFQKTFSVSHLANLVQSVGKDFGLDVEVRPIKNPRNEKEDHYYNPEHKHLFDLGYIPKSDILSELHFMFEQILPYKYRIEEKREAVFPTTTWD